MSLYKHEYSIFYRTLIIFIYNQSWNFLIQHPTEISDKKLTEDRCKKTKKESQNKKGYMKYTFNKYVSLPLFYKYSHIHVAPAKTQDMNLPT